MSETKSKPNFLIPAIAGIGIIAIGGAAAYFYFTRPSGDALSPLAAAKLVPDEAVVISYISTDPKSWAKLQEFGTPELQKYVQKSLDDFNKDLAKDSQIDYDKDIKPWLGNVTIAVLPSNPTKPAQATSPEASPEESPEASESPKASPKASPDKSPVIPAPKSSGKSEENVLIVLGMKDKVAALKFAEKQKGEKKETDYKGVKITEYKSEKEGKNPTHVAVLSDHLVVGELKTIQAAIDTTKGEPSLASKGDMATLLKKGVDVKNPVAQIYVPEYSTFAKEILAKNPNTPPLPPETIEQFAKVKSVAAGVGIDDSGVRLKAIANLDPNSLKVEFKPAPGQIVSLLPADTLGLISGNSIKTYWQGFVEQAKADPQLSKGLEDSKKQIQTATKLDLDKDIFGWMDSEFAIAAIPSDKGILQQLGFGGAIVLQTGDRATAEATMGKVDTLAKGNGIKIAERDIGGKKFTDWEVPQQGALLSHGWLDQNTLLIAIGGPIADTMASKPAQSLDASEGFKAVTGTLQKPNMGYFYVDMDKVMTLSRKFNPTGLPPEQEAIASSIRGIGVTSQWKDKSTSEFEFLLALKPKAAK